VRWRPQKDLPDGRGFAAFRPTDECAGFCQAIDVDGPIRHILAAPVKRPGVISITGTVRETDLDENRFEVRRIENGIITDLRCIYGPKVIGKIAAKWLNHRVEVIDESSRWDDLKPPVTGLRTF
jgi:hypothetical protein